jgi:oligopeptide/dipeptide ABC transporter ATP-binding protein
MTSDRAISGEPLLEVENLSTSFFTREGTIKAVQSSSFSVRPGEVLGVVGESGSGKSVTALSIMGLVPYPGRVTTGSVRYHGQELLYISEEEMRNLRGDQLAMIFQDPVAALNPLMTIGNQVEELLAAHGTMSQNAMWDLTLDSLRSVGLPEPRVVMDSYPWQLSGGMCQRVMLAMMLIMEPELLIADEPTSSLDTTLQAEMLERIHSLARDRGTAVILITHNLGVVARVADRVLVMYGGRMMEESETVALYQRPAHPYTWALLNAVPRLDDPLDRDLRPVPGQPPDLKDPVDECPFLPRCNKATNECRTSPMPPLRFIEPDHSVACYNPIFQEDRVEQKPD